MLLLPPRPAGEKLPEEIVRAYEPDPVSVPTLDHEESVENHQPEPDVANDSASLGHASKHSVVEVSSLVSKATCR